MAVYMRKAWLIVTIYSAAHFVVDFACAFLMFRAISMSADWYTCVLLYNFCAFAMQMPMGVVADKLNRNHLVAAAGCILVCAGYALAGLPGGFGPVFMPIMAAITAGLGNGMFHIGGGIDVLNISAEMDAGQSGAQRAAPCGLLGVFVSPGALGVYFGAAVGKTGGLSALPIMISLIVAATLIPDVRRISRCTIQNAEFSPETPRPALIAAACLFLVVCLRSYTGLSIDFPWKTAGHWGLALVLASAFGKAAGGFLAGLRVPDGALGARRSAALSLGIAAVLFLFPQTPAAGVAAMFLFNMSMPITLWGMAKLFPGAKGFSFGLLTFALFLGFLPGYLGAGAPPLLVFAPLSAISLALTVMGLRKGRT